MTPHTKASAIRKEVQIGDCRLLLGDMNEVLPELGRFDLCLTDPPYGIADLWGAEQAGKNGKSRLWTGDNDWDKETVPVGVNAVRAIAEKSIIWGGNYYDLPPSRGYLVWDKMQVFSNADSELAWCSWDQTPRTFRYARAQLASEGKQHPTQKPLPLMEWCLSHVPGAKTVVDPFAGSGTTGVACVKRGLTFTGIERHEPYFDIMCARIQDAHSRPDMFIEPRSPEPKQETLFAGVK